jgi:hypothetical protein
MGSHSRAELLRQASRDRRGPTHLALTPCGRPRPSSCRRDEAGLSADRRSLAGCWKRTEDITADLRGRRWRGPGDGRAKVGRVDDRSCGPLERAAPDEIEAPSLPEAADNDRPRPRRTHGPSSQYAADTPRSWSARPAGALRSAQGRSALSPHPFSCRYIGPRSIGRAHPSVTRHRSAPRPTEASGSCPNICSRLSSRRTSTSSAATSRATDTLSRRRSSPARSGRGG